MSRFGRCVFFVSVVTVLPACGSPNKYLALHPKPLETPVEVLKERHLLSVEVVDSRKSQEVVGNQCDDRRLYLVRDSVADVVKSALGAEFARRGFALGEGSAVVKIVLKEFFFRRCGSSSLVSRTREARVAFEVEVCGKDGVAIYRTTVYGGDSQQPGFGSDVYADDALERALSNSIVRLFADQSLESAILGASRN